MFDHHDDKRFFKIQYQLKSYVFYMKGFRTTVQTVKKGFVICYTFINVPIGRLRARFTCIQTMVLYLEQLLQRIEARMNSEERT